MASILRCLIRELQHAMKTADAKGSTYRDLASYRYIINCYRKNLHASPNKQSDLLQYLAESYIIQLHHAKKYQALVERYHLGNESVEKVSRHIGFELPPKK
ncbi:UPF0562 protein C7orf55-like protein [Trichoplax sp. H2]|nr:UPF0562 protein C7orf55-like protein [Trichoplax sp. H2]|eukprot:RDD45641.1 UPF0562 protein C7orf55-like protein [Trichoplax sp. H2]